MQNQVVMATNLAYLPYAQVAYFTLLSHASKATHLTLLHTGIDKKELASFEKLVRKMALKKGLSHTFSEIKIDASRVNFGINIDYISIETYLRFFIPDLITADKALYLDADTLVCKDLQPLFDMELGDNYIAGVKDPYITRNDPEAQEHLRTLGDGKCGEDYVNAGVLLLNLTALRRDSISAKWVQAITSKSYQYQDQDVINEVCHSRILLIDHVFNNMSCFFGKPARFYRVIKYWDNFCAKKLFHFTGPDKPWQGRHYLRRRYVRQLKKTYAIIGEAEDLSSA